MDAVLNFQGVTFKAFDLSQKDKEKIKETKGLFSSLKMIVNVTVHNVSIRNETETVSVTRTMWIADNILESENECILSLVSVITLERFFT